MRYINIHMPKYIERIRPQYRPEPKMYVPPETVAFNSGDQAGPIGVFSSTFAYAWEHTDSAYFIFFMPDPDMDYAMLADSSKISMRQEGSRSIVCKMPGMPSLGDKTGHFPAFRISGVEEDYFRTLAEDLFDLPRLEIPFRAGRMSDGLELDLSRFLGTLPAEDSDRAALMECLQPLICVGYLLSCLPELRSRPIFRYRHPGIQNARRLIETEYRSSLALRDLAAAAGLSRSQFIAAFKRQVGSTPHDYLRRIRAERAKRILARGWGVTTAAFEVGFSSLGSFEKAFMRYVGVSPSEYRRRTR
jgi:AraC-like DNA-binding protein